MASNGYSPLTAERAAEKMAALFNKELGLAVAGEDVLRVFKGNWSELSYLAHAIHDDFMRRAAAEYQRAPVTST